MMTSSKIFLIGTAILCMVLDGFADVATLSVPKADKPPVLDGQIKDEEWAFGVKSGKFMLLGSPTNAATEQTQAFIMRDDENLYVAFRCHESQVGRIKATVNERNGNVWEDDDVEFFICNGDNTFNYRQFAVNSIGIQWDDRGGKEGDWQAISCVGSNLWSMEMAIPFTCLGIKARERIVLRGHFCRGEKPRDENSAWPAITEERFDDLQNSARIDLGPYKAVAMRETETLKRQREEIQEIRQTIRSLRSKFDGARFSWRVGKTWKIWDEIGRHWRQRKTWNVWRERISGKLAALEHCAEDALTPGKAENIPASLEEIKKLINAFGAGKLVFSDMATYSVRPIQNKRILPDTRDIPGEISDTLHMAATPGEYEPTSFVIRAEKDIEGLTIEAEELKGRDGKRIPSESLDVRVVKCWHQDLGRGYRENTPYETYYNPIIASGKKVLVPELLLKDDGLIKVDMDKGDDFLRVEKDGREEYLIITSTNKNEGVSGALYVPVNDAASLRPVNIKTLENKQFWITVRVPERAEAGIYETKLKLKGNDGNFGCIKFELRVLPFKLAEPYEISGMYFTYINDGDQNVFAQFKNLAEHGVRDAGFGWGAGRIAGSLEGFEEQLKMRQMAGMNAGTVYTPIEIGNTVSDAGLEKLRSKVKRVLTITRAYGVTNVYFYGIDEAISVKEPDEEGIKNILSQRKAFEAVHAAGGKIYVAGMPTGVYKDKRAGGDFEFIGDILDLLVCSKYPSRQEASRWHDRGHKIVNYANPQAGMEQPETYRKNYGLLIWQQDYDGAMTYCYHWYWGDFLEKCGSINKYKQHNMVYATRDGVIDTIQWEGYREGVDDVRYLNTLIQAIKEAANSPNGNIRQLAKEADEYLKILKDKDVNKYNLNMDIVRMEMIEYVLKLKGL